MMDNPVVPLVDLFTPDYQSYVRLMAYFKTNLLLAGLYDATLASHSVLYGPCAKLSVGNYDESAIGLRQRNHLLQKAIGYTY